MNNATLSVLSIFLLLLACFSCEELGDVSIVLMTEHEAYRTTGAFVLEDNYCLDPVLPRSMSSCHIRVLAPQDGVYSNSRISEMTLDFKHPSRPNTACHIRWPWGGDVRSWCERIHPFVFSWRLPAFRSETATSGNIVYNDLIASENRCENDVKRIRYYRDGLNGYPIRRPTVVILIRIRGCVAGLAMGRRVNNFRTTEAPCVFNRRRRCRPLTRSQYDALIRDIEAGEQYVDFRTSSQRPPTGY